MIRSLSPSEYFHNLSLFRVNSIFKNKTGLKWFNNPRITIFIVIVINDHLPCVKHIHSSSDYFNITSLFWVNSIFKNNSGLKWFNNTRITIFTVILSDDRDLLCDTLSSFQVIAFTPRHFAVLNRSRRFDKSSPVYQSCYKSSEIPGSAVLTKLLWCSNNVYLSHMIFSLLKKVCIISQTK